MTYEGRVHNGVIVIQGGAVLPEGVRVRIETDDPEPAAPTLNEPLGPALLQFAGVAENLPEDLARNHDHYLHGLPRL